MLGLWCRPTSSLACGKPQCSLRLFPPAPAEASTQMRIRDFRDMRPGLEAERAQGLLPRWASNLIAEWQTTVLLRHPSPTEKLLSRSTSSTVLWIKYLSRLDKGGNRRTLEKKPKEEAQQSPHPAVPQPDASPLTYSKSLLPRGNSTAMVRSPLPISHTALPLRQCTRPRSTA